MREERFWSKVEKTESCWLWRGNLLPRGYGSSAKLRGTKLAHRIAWLLLRPDEDIDGLHLHHTCGNRACVNPEHLEPMTGEEHKLLHDERVSGATAVSV